MVENVEFINNQIYFCLFFYRSPPNPTEIFPPPAGILVNISMWFSLVSRLSKNNRSSPPGQDRLLWITSETQEDDLVI